jgi:murein DD-endopeptidase MepM/ murein hydrolase activator NlpD
LLNASVGVQRALDRLRPAPGSRSSTARLIQVHSLALARGVRGLVLPDRHGDAADQSTRTAATAAVAPTAPAPTPQAPAVSSSPRTSFPASLPVRSRARSALAPRSVAADHARIVAPEALPRRSIISRVGAERAVPAMAVAILLVATAISSAPALAQPGATGGTDGVGQEARIAVGGALDAVGGPDEPVGGPDEPIGDSAAAGLGVISNDPDPWEEIEDPAAARPAAAGTLDDGTILKPVAVDTVVADGKDLMRTYKVRPGDTLTGIARKFGVSMMTVWWANKLRHKDDLHIGQTLTIPPVSGVVVTVGSSDTLDTLSAKYGVQASEIVAANELDDPNLVIGQTLTIPGGKGAGIPTPTPAPKPKASSSGGSSGGSSRPPTRYSGGAFAWPVAGGSISQYYHYGHYAIDIQANSGTPVKAAASGTVIFAGWKSNGGGYQVWIAHGSNLYTTYNHMSSVGVGRGQSVGRGQQIGRVGSSGWATGPHLHFEVWQGPIWNGGTRVNPLRYL